MTNMVHQSVDNDVDDGDNNVNVDDDDNQQKQNTIWAVLYKTGR